MPTEPISAPRPLRILHVQGEYWAFGGAETYLRDLVQAQMAAGHEVSVVYSSEAPAGYAAKPWEHFAGRSYGLRSGLAGFARFRRILRSLNPEILHLHVTHYHLSPLILRYLIACKPTIQTVHDTLAFCFKEPNAGQLADWARILPDESACNRPVGFGCFQTGCAKTFFVRPGFLKGTARIFSVLWKRSVHRRIDRLLANSSWTREDLIRNGFAPRKVQTFPCRSIVPDSWRELKNFPAPDADKTPVILYVGKLSSLKGVPRLLAALALLRGEKWRAVLAGAGEELAAIRRLIVELDLAERVEIVESVPREKIADYYRAARLVVFPSVWPEPFGLVGPEAMYFGKPVVAFRVGGVIEWLDDNETGYLVEPGDVAGLAARIQELLRNPARAAELGREGQARSGRFFGIAEHIEELLGLYRETIATH